MSDVLTGLCAENDPLLVMPDWAKRAFSASDAWFEGAPPQLAGRLARVRERIASSHNKSSMAGALTAPFATPFLALIEAQRIDLHLPDTGVVDAVAEGTLALYLYLRVQDDIVDEPALFDPSNVYAGEIFAGKSAEAFARAVGAQPVFWSFRSQALADLAGESAWEIDVYRSVDPMRAGERAEDDAARLGAKLAPCAIPLAALSVAAGRASDLQWLLPFARALGAGLQIHNDLLNARDDHAGGRLTPSLAALYSGGRVTPDSEPHRVWPALAGDPALARMTSAARAFFERANEIAREHGALALADVAASRLPALDRIASHLLQLSLGVRP